jgi:glucose/arabinose dehydrogenase
MKSGISLAFALVLASVLTGCYVLRPSSGGGQTTFHPPRRVNPADIALPQGYRIETVATGLTFPTGVTFDDQDRVYIIESGYSYGEVWTTPRLLRIDPNGRAVQIIAGTTNGPWTGATFHNGHFYISEGGEMAGGRILRVNTNGAVTVLASNLPSMGDHHTDGPVIGPDGWLYFGQGTASNSGIVGEDNAQFGWLHRHTNFHDISPRDIQLSGENFTTQNPLSPDSKEKVLTGAFLPFGTPSNYKQTIQGRMPCTGAILRVHPENQQLELVAWGLRNPFGLAFSPDGRLFATENAYDDRGSRPIWGAPDVLWEIKPGLWYGWPDYSAGMPLTMERFKPPGKAQPQFLLVEHPNTPPSPIALFGVHASANGFDFSRDPRFGHVGDAFVALFGDQAPTVGKLEHPVGFKIVRVNVANGEIQSFAANKGKQDAPASLLKRAGFERPLAARFNRAGTALYIVDFGVLTQTKKGAHPQPGTGVLWCITHE